MPKTSFARPPQGGAAPSRAPLPPGRSKPNVTATTAPAAPAPPKRPTPPAPPAVASKAPLPPGARPKAPTPPQAKEEISPELEVLPPQEEQQEEPPAAPAPPAPRLGRPKGATNKPKAPTNALAVLPPAEAQDAADMGRVVVFTGALGKVEGDLDSSDYTIPQLKIAGYIGPLSLLQPPILPGALVIGAVEQWEYLYLEGAEGWEPLGVTVLRTRKSLAQIKNEAGEKLYDIEEQGMVFDTKEEMKAAGGTLQDVLGMKVCEAVMLAHVLVRMPVGLDNQLGFFDIEIDGQLYGQAMWKIRGSAYRDCAKKIYDESKAGRFIGEHSYDGEFLMTGKEIIGDRNKWWIPRIECGEVNSEVFVNYIVENQL